PLTCPISIQAAKGVRRSPKAETSPTARTVRSDRLSLWERPRAARVRGAYERKRSRSYAPLTPALSQREREMHLRDAVEQQIVDVGVTDAGGVLAGVGLAEGTTDDDRHDLLVTPAVRTEAVADRRQVVLGSGFAKRSPRISGH